jgi:hypothetical protein
MELSKQDQVVISILNSIEQMGFKNIQRSTELGTGAIHIKAQRADGIEINAIVDAQGRAHYD